MRLSITLALVAAALALAASADAHETTWRWNAPKANLSLLEEGLQYQDGFHEVYDARCYGFGPWLDGKHRRMFKHFRCHVSTFEDLFYWIELHVTGKNTRVFRFLRWAES